MENFETRLRNHIQKPIPLYSNNNKKSKNTGTHIPLIEPMDIISTVSSQIKALQDADTNKNYKCVRKKINEYNKSGFLPLNLMPTYVEVRAHNAPHMDKSETQCVSNTQLISIVENAEALIDPFKGITQEFESTFINIEKDNNNIKIKDNVINKDCNRDTINMESEIRESQQMFNPKNITTTILDDNINSEYFKVPIKDEDWTELEMADCQIQTVSPILNDAKHNYLRSNTINDMNIVDRKSNTPSPLVVNLEYYEKFENIAVAIIKENLDLKTTKHLINSQINSLEMSIIAQSCNVLLNNKEKNILINASETSQNPVNVITYNDNECHFGNNHEHENLNKTFEDEILFSSDEEGFMETEVQGVPLTGALETSFEKQSDILNSTMYVGFQTASNKSIQIHSKSFSKAKSILGEPEKSCNSKESSFTELVEMADINNKHYDRKIAYIPSFKQINTSQNNAKIVTENGNIIQPSISKEETGNLIANSVYVIHESQAKLCQELDKQENVINANIVGNSNLEMKTNEVDDLKTAENKKIEVPNRTLPGCQKVFCDINWNKKFELDINDCKINLNSISKVNKNVKTSENAVGEITNVFSDSNKEKDIDINLASSIFLGFKTASNKTISVSDKALLKSSKVFQDIENVEYVNNAGQDFTCKSKCMHEFRTASNKQIKVSMQAYSKTKRLFQDLGMDDIPNISGNNSPNADVKRSINKNIGIPEYVLSKSMDIFQNIKANDRPHISSNSKTGCAGFKPASNKTINISESAQQNTKSLFQNMNTVDITKITENIPSDYLTNFVGFRTASNKQITISEKSLSTVKCLFQDLERDIPQKFECSTFETTVSECVPGRNNIKITKQALADTRNNCQDTNMDISRMMIASKDSNTDTIFAGFKTANNKVIKISQQALTKTKRLFEDINFNEINEKSILTGCKTPSNKVIQNSEQASAVTKHLFEEVEAANAMVENDILEKPKKINDTLKNECNSILIDDCKTEFQRFQIVGGLGDKIDIDECKEICEYSGENIKDNNNDNFVENKKNIAFRGFQTASKKQVIVSKEALAKSKLLLEDIQTENNFHIGFTTASNNKIEINNESLAKARHLLKDLDDSLNDRQELNDVNHNIETNITDKKPNSRKQSFVGDKKFNMAKIVKSKTTFDANDNNTSIENFIDTQILNDFEKTLCTEDFCKDLSPKPIKRSVSPIFLCPKAKKRKRFETPFKNNSKVVVEDKLNTNLKKDNEINFDYKKNNNVKLKDLDEMEKDSCKVSNIDPYILNFTFDTLLDFEFFDKRNDLTGTKMNISSLKEYFLGAVNKNLIPEGWLDNHLKLLLWKLISYEIKFPSSMKNVLTARNVVKQLKYRYDREIYNVERPALRKILERDDVSTRTIILCVAEIYIDGTKENSAARVNNNVELLLSDGWYSVKATIDKMLTKLVCDKKIVVGSKIVTHGAELLHCEQGVSPLEDTSLIRLKLSGNSTKLAKWDARLGYHSNAAILTNLSTVKPEGGKVSKLRLFVTRVYPTLYVEKFEDGSTVTRSERLENLYQMKYEAERQIMLEKLYEEVEKEHSDQESQDSESNESNKRKCLDSGSQIAKIMRKSKDPAEFTSTLTKSQSNLLEDYTSKQREKILQDLNKKFQKKLEDKGLNVSRNVVGLLKIRVAGINEKSGAIEVTRGMMSIWKPHDAITEIINEGSWIEVLNVVPTAIRYSEVQLSASRQSVFIQSKFKENDKIKPFTKSLMRACYEIRDLAQKPTLTTDYNEIDTVGLVFLIEPSIKEFDSTKDKNFQNVYLTDADKNLICVNFWGGLKKFGFENVLEVGQIVAGINLQRRAGNSRKSIPQFRVTEFSYFTKTPKSESAKKIVEDLIKKMSGIDRRKFCDDCLVLKENFSNVKLQGNENITPYRVNHNVYNIHKNRIFIETPLAEKNRRVDDDLNLIGLDFESNFQTEDTQGQVFSPNILLRKKRFNEKMAKLKMYGEPPPLSTIHILNKSKNAEKAYKSPVILKTDVTSIEKKLPEESPKDTYQDSTTPSSPIIQINRTFVKRNNVNPTKLNFSNSVGIEENSFTNLANHFAEEFDGSPPLSLDSSDCI